MSNTAIKKLETIQNFVWYFIFLQALVAMLGSLYYSTFGDPVTNIIAGNPFPQNSGFTPCVLCWYARILMYPIVPLSLIGGVKNDKNFVDYILPLSIMGMFLDTYHYMLQKTQLVTSLGCTNNNPCNAMEVNYFGFLTIPLLALIAFTVITVLCIIYKILNKKIAEASN